MECRIFFLPRRRWCPAPSGRDAAPFFPFRALFLNAGRLLPSRVFPSLRGFFFFEASACGCTLFFFREMDSAEEHLFPQKKELTSSSSLSSCAEASAPPVFPGRARKPSFSESIRGAVFLPTEERIELPSPWDGFCQLKMTSPLLPKTEVVGSVSFVGQARNPFFPPNSVGPSLPSALPCSRPLVSFPV